MTQTNGLTNRFKLLLGNKMYAIAWMVLFVSVMLSIFVRIPFGFFDEQVHYIRALGVENTQLVSYSKDGDMSKLGHDIDSSYTSYIGRYLDDKANVISVQWLTEPGEIRAGESAYSVNTGAAAYTPVPYLPYAAAAKLSQMVNLDIKSEFILMRLFGALTALCLIAAAFVSSPSRYRWVVMAVALVPMSIAAFASISTDGFTIAIALLFMATMASIVDKIRRRRLVDKDVIILGTVSILLVTAKIPIFMMIALILCVLVVFWRKIEKRHKIYLFLIIAVTAAMTLAWALYAKGINTGAFWGRNVDTLEQLRYILENPLSFLKNLTYSMLSFNYADLTYNLYADSGFYATLPFIIDMVVLAGLGLSSFVVTKLAEPSKELARIYLAQAVLFVAISGAIFILLYLQFTPIGTPNQIEGVQPRYFIPFLPLLIMMPYKMRLSEKWRTFAYAAPFVGVVVYLAYIIIQLV